VVSALNQSTRQMPTSAGVYWIRISIMVGLVSEFRTLLHHRHGAPR